MGKPRQKTVFETPEFLALRKEWYGKLKKKGFKDIEHTNWEDGTSGNLLNGMTLMDMLRSWTPEQQRYYELAVHYIRNVRWRRAKGLLEAWQVKAWILHANGKSYHQIGEAVGVHRRYVSKYVREEAKRMMEHARRSEETPDVG